MYSWRYLTFAVALVLCAATWNAVEAFVAPPQQLGMPTAAATTATTTAFPTKGLAMVPVKTSLTVASSTVDPTSFLQDILGNVLGTPIILAVPILAALAVASLVVFAIVAYANPAEPDD